MNSPTIQGVDYSVRAETQLSVAFAVVAVISVLILIGWFYRCERGSSGKVLRSCLVALRCACLFLVLWMLFGYARRRYSVAKPILAVVVDSSDSMAIKDDGEKQSRFDEAISKIESLPKRLKNSLTRQYDTRWFRLAAQLNNVTADWFDLEPFELASQDPTNESRLGGGIAQVVKSYGGGALAGIVLLSDGVNTGGQPLEAAGREASQYGVPIHTIAVGRKEPAPDARIIEVLNDREIYAGDNLVVVVQLSLNVGNEQRAVLRLVDESDDSILDTTEVRIIGQTGQATMIYTNPPVGVHQLRVELEPLEAEEMLVNNRLRTSVKVRDAAIRVLIVFQRPSYEFRYLKHWLERARGDSSKSTFQVDSVLQTAETEYVQQDASAIRLVPARDTDLSTYDAFIFGDCRMDLVSQGTQQRIIRSVTEEGAGCVFVFGRGQPTRSWSNEPIGALLPAEIPAVATASVETESLFGWQPTSQGSSVLPMFFREAEREASPNLPLISSVAEVGRVKPGAQTVLVAVGQGTQQPLVVSQFAGMGRVLLQLTDESFHLANYRGTDALYQKYWLNILRWSTRGRLAQEGQFELNVSPKQLRAGGTANVMLRVSRTPGQEPVVTAEGDDGKVQRVNLMPSPDSPIEFRGEFTPPSVGVYTIATEIPKLGPQPGSGLMYWLQMSSRIS